VRRGHGVGCVSRGELAGLHRVANPATPADSSLASAPVLVPATSVSASSAARTLAAATIPAAAAAAQCVALAPAWCWCLPAAELI